MRVCGRGPARLSENKSEEREREAREESSALAVAGHSLIFFFCSLLSALPTTAPQGHVLSFAVAATVALLAVLTMAWTCGRAGPACPGAWRRTPPALNAGGGASRAAASPRPTPAPFLGGGLPPPLTCTLDACPVPSLLTPAASPDASPDAPSKWWEEGADAWDAAPATEVGFRAAVDAPPGKLVLVDFYATWCAGCAKVYPVLVGLASDPDLSGRLSLVKVCNDRLGALSRAEGAAALPHIGLYGQGGVKLLDFQARPSRLHLLKGNLVRMLAGDGGPAPPPGKAWALDADGVVGLVDAAARAAFEVEAAAAVADLRATTSLSDRLMAMAGGGASAPPPPPSTSSLSDRLARLAGGGPPPPAGRSTPSTDHKPSPEEAAFRAHPVYGPMYNPRADGVYDAEVGPRMPPGHHYLDYTGAGLYLNSQVEAFSAELTTTLFGNPHSANPSSSRSDAAIEGVRAQVLAWVHADPAEWQVVFTASATAAAKLVGEAFPWVAGSTYLYLRESHTSLLGLREYARACGADFHALSEEEVEAMIEEGRAPPSPTPTGPTGPMTFSLFSFPAESNFDGVKHDPAAWVGPVRQALSTPTHRMMVAVDASAWLPTQPLDLAAAPADFVFLSFYKVFGFPTGVGALLMRNDAAAVLHRPYFGGGTVALALADSDFVQAKCRPADAFADGSPSFLDIAALRHGFAAFERLGGAAAASPHVAALAHWGAEALGRLRHANGAPVALVFGKHAHPDWSVLQGGVLNFELLDARGEPLSYRAFEAAAAAAGLHLRCGSLCAPGAAYAAADVSEAEIRTLADSGDKEGCGDEVESILVERPAQARRRWGDSEGGGASSASTSTSDTEWVRRPLGTIRASFGATSTFRDVEALVRFVQGWARGAGR